MAGLPRRHYGNFPQRRANLLPRATRRRAQLALEAASSETGLNPASVTERRSSGFCVMEKESCRAAFPSLEKRQRQPGKDVAAVFGRMRIHPEAQRILGTSCIPVVSLERLNLKAVSLASLQPVVSLARLSCQTQAELHNDVSGVDHPQQNGLSQNEAEVWDTSEAPQPEAEEWPDLSQPGTPRTSWTEPYCPDSFPSGELEQDSGFDCESNPDQPYILFDSVSDDWDLDPKTDTETFYLDPDPDQTMVIELDPDPEEDQDPSLELEDESEAKCDVVLTQIDDTEDQTADLCCSQEETDLFIQQPGPGPGPGTEEMESEDFCAVCLNGGNLLCCDRCPKVYHLACHVPPLSSFPLGDWECTLCRTDQEPGDPYDCESTPSCGGVKAPYTLSNQDQRRCEKLTLLLYCHTLSAPFHEAVSPLARNYYQIIKRPINLSVIRRKLDKSNTLHYFSADQFVDDILLMFKNCATFNYPDSEVAQAGQKLEALFFSKLTEVFPDRMFPSASQDKTDRARLRWLSRKRKENHKKKKHVFHGKKYYL